MNRLIKPLQIGGFRINVYKPLQCVPGQHVSRLLPTYYRFKEIRGFLEDVNQTLPSDEWKIHCVRFTPNCPEQNPIESKHKKKMR
jgi:transposase